MENFPGVQEIPVEASELVVLDHQPRFIQIGDDSFWACDTCHRSSEYGVTETEARRELNAHLRNPISHDIREDHRKRAALKDMPDLQTKP